MFNLKQNGTDVSTEIMAGLTTFFAMAYIIVVNPSILSQAGMEWGAVFLATIISAIIGTLVMGLVANVPYAQAPGMGLNAFFVYTVCFALKFTWQQALSMVFICGVINILITVTKLRKHIIKSIPVSLQKPSAEVCHICCLYRTITLVPLILMLRTGGATLDKPALWLFLIGLVLTAVPPSEIQRKIWHNHYGAYRHSHGTYRNRRHYKFYRSSFSTSYKLVSSTKRGLDPVFDANKVPLVLITIFAESVDTLIHRNLYWNLLSLKHLQREDESMETSSGFKSKMDKALFADATATSIGAIFGTSNTTTYVESAAGIAAGGRTGLTSVVVAICFALSAFLATFVSAIPSAATAPALVVVGIMMMSSFNEINWSELTEAVPAFFAGVFMALCYSISYGIAAGFIFYVITKLCKREAKDVHPILWVSVVLFILNFVLLAIL